MMMIDDNDPIQTLHTARRGIFGDWSVIIFVTVHRPGAKKNLRQVLFFSPATCCSQPPTHRTACLVTKNE